MNTIDFVEDFVDDVDYLDDVDDIEKTDMMSPSVSCTTFDSTESPPQSLLTFLASCFDGDPTQALNAVDAASRVLLAVNSEQTQDSNNGKTDAQDLAAVVLAALAAASIKAESLAALEERQMRRLVLAAASVQLQKLDAKLRQLASYEWCVEDEWVLLERARIRVLSQRILLVRNQILLYSSSTDAQKNTT